MFYWTDTVTLWNVLGKPLLSNYFEVCTTHYLSWVSQSLLSATLVAGAYFFPAEHKAVLRRGVNYCFLVWKRAYVFDVLRPWVWWFLSFMLVNINLFPFAMQHSQVNNILFLIYIHTISILHSMLLLLHTIFMSLCSSPLHQTTFSKTRLCQPGK